MNNEFNETKEKEISIMSLLKVLRKNIVVILIVTVIVAMLAGAYSAFFQDTTYTTTSSFYVKNILATSGYVTDQMLSAASKIADSCVEVSNTDFLAAKAVEAHDLDKYFKVPESNAVSYVKSMISAGKKNTDSQEFYVNVTSLNPEHTYKVALAVQDVMDDVIKAITTDSEDSISAPGVLLLKEVQTEKDVKTEKPSLMKMAIVGAMLGLVASYVVFLIIFLNDTKVYDEETVKSHFNYPIIGSIPHWISASDEEAKKLSRKKLLMRDTSKTNRKYDDKLLNEKTPFAITESFKHLRTNLAYSVTSGETPVFAITSDFSGAGKSVVSANIAVAFAEFGKKTLLVEGDMRCPDFKHIFGGTYNKIGLSELLSGNVRSKKLAVTNVGYGNLSVIFSGRKPPNPSELLGSPKMDELVKEWKESFDVIIIDMPPVVEVTDASVISPIVDAYVLVARSEHSDVNALSSSVEKLKTVQGNILGFVVNDINPKSGKSGKYAYGKYKKYSTYETLEDSHVIVE